jgi:DNA-binding transcriptional ArsR family regulator
MKIKYTHKLKIGHSRVFEVLSLITALLDDKHQSFVIDLKPYEEIKVKYMDLLDCFRQYPKLNLVWFEFALVVDERYSVEAYFKSILNLAKSKQLLYFLAHDCDENDIKKGLQSVEDMQKLLESMAFQHSNDLAQCLIDFDNTCKRWSELAISIDNCIAFEKALAQQEIQSDLNNQTAEFHKSLNDRHPLSYSQALMGKPFWNIADYRVYEFIPVYFLSPIRFRLMDDKTQIMVQSIYRTPVDPLKIGSELAEVMKILGDPTRLKILQMLFMRPLYGKEIADAIGLTTPTVSHHLEALHNKGLINMEQHKQIKYFSTNLPTIRKWLNTMENYVKNNIESRKTSSQISEDEASILNNDNK